MSKENTLKNSIGSAFQYSIPILCSFIPLGFGFGYYGMQLGLPWHVIILMSAIIYAGSSEFLLAAMLIKAIPIADILIATSLVNLRHIFYGISVQQHYPKDFLRRLYMIHALTDETYSILAAKKENDHTFSVYLSVFNHIYWVIGVILGVMTGKCISIKIEGLEFCLTSLFVVLTLEKAFQTKRIFPFVLALIASALGFLVFPNQMLFISMITVTLLLIFCYKFNLIRNIG